jgi:hypothetical protein
VSDGIRRSIVPVELVERVELYVAAEDIAEKVRASRAVPGTWRYGVGAVMDQVLWIAP